MDENVNKNVIWQYVDEIKDYSVRRPYDNVKIGYEVNIWCLNIYIDEYDWKRKNYSKIHDMNNINDVNMDFIYNYIH